jgi:hypothetical protein
MKQNKTKVVFTRVDMKLFNQIQKYADRNDEGVVARTARKALIELLKIEDTNQGAE